MLAAESELCGKLARQVKAALRAELDVDEDDVRLQLVHLRDRVGARGGDAHDIDALAVEQQADHAQEVPVVVDDQAPKAHGFSQSPRCRGRRK